jgi:hypothetical protein
MPGSRRGRKIRAKPCSISGSYPTTVRPWLRRMPKFRNGRLTSLPCKKQDSVA